jgi:hypothetical protein
MSQVIGLNELARDWDRALEALGESFRRAVQEGTKAGLAAVKRKHTGFTPRTGDLTGRLANARLTLATRSRAVGRMMWFAKYALSIDRGAKPHEIHPKLSAEGGLRGSGDKATQKRRGKSDIGTSRVKLRWIGPDGQYVFAVFVRHPGNRIATHFTDEALQPCVDAAMKEIGVGIAKVKAVLQKAQ